MSYNFTNDWFENNRHVWGQIFSKWAPRKILEIGSYEGRSACFMIEALKDEPNVEIHCVDTWQGGEEHAEINMNMVWDRFNSNIAHAKSLSNSSANVVVHKGYSFDVMVSLCAKGYVGAFDMIYVDGSHQAPDVLEDLILAYRLVKVGGVVICDDYVWRLGNVLHEPKIAIDSFVNINRERVAPIVDAPLRQFYFIKTS